MLNRIVARIGQRCQHPTVLLPALNGSTGIQQRRQMTHYPIDDIITGLTEEQIQVYNFFKLDLHS